MSQRVHLAWGCVSLVMAGVGFALGSAERPATPSASDSSGAPGAPLAAAQSKATSDLEPPRRASAAEPHELPSGSRSEAPTQAQSVQGSAAFDASALPRRDAPPEPEAPRPLPPVPLVHTALDPDAEALVRALFRLQIEPPGEFEQPTQDLERRQAFVSRAVSGVLDSVTPLERERLLVALTAYVPLQTEWQNYGEVTKGLLAAALSAHSLNPTPKSLESLVQLLSASEPGSIDPDVVERLARRHPDHEELASLVATYLPKRAREVFALDGYTQHERELLVDIVGEADAAKGALLARELLLETQEVSYLLSALTYDPAGTADFLRARRGDPAWEELSAAAKVHQVYNEEGPAELEAAVAATWRQLSTEHLAETLYMLADDETWTPLEDQILRRLLESPDEDVRETALWHAPYSVRWRLRAERARAQGYVPDEEMDEGRMDLDHFLEFLELKPFLAKSSLNTLYESYPNPTLQDLFRLASTFQEKGDNATAADALERAPLGPARTIAIAHLKAGRSLEDLTNEDSFADLLYPDR